ncbi:MAG: hypothetical protein JWQ35_1901 [Bacteriovoracaceae bacterium]|nr:hypothetical protein [Bacteriovoracaceae bacterium]
MRNTLRHLILFGFFIFLGAKSYGVEAEPSPFCIATVREIGLTNSFAYILEKHLNNLKFNIDHEKTEVSFHAKNLTPLSNSLFWHFQKQKLTPQKNKVLETDFGPFGTQFNVDQSAVMIISPTHAAPMKYILWEKNESKLFKELKELITNRVQLKVMADGQQVGWGDIAFDPNTRKVIFYELRLSKAFQKWGIATQILNILYEITPKNYQLSFTSENKETCQAIWEKVPTNWLRLEASEKKAISIQLTNEGIRLAESGNRDIPLIRVLAKTKWKISEIMPSDWYPDVVFTAEK